MTFKFKLNTKISALRGMNRIVLPTVSIGRAESLLKSDRAVHSRFKLPVPRLNTSTIQF